MASMAVSNVQDRAWFSCAQTWLHTHVQILDRRANRRYSLASLYLVTKESA